MEKPKNFLCSECDNLLEITNGDYLFSYNTKCCNNHIEENIDLEDLLLKYRTNENLYKCKTHKKKSIIHCYDCKDDICLFCANDLHRNHKYDYLNKFKKEKTDKIHYNENNMLKNAKALIDTFFVKLDSFLNNLKLYINFLKIQMKKEFQFRDELINNIINNKIYSYIDIENANSLLNVDSYKKIINNINNFCDCNTFFEKYDCLRKIFEEQIQKGKYIENIELNNIYDRFELIPLGNRKYIKFEFNSLFIIKETSKPTSTKFQSELLFKYNINHSENYNSSYRIRKIIIKNNIQNKLSLYILGYNYTMDYFLKQLTINNFSDLNVNTKDYDIKELIIKDINHNLINNILVLSEDHNLIFTEQGEIYLYNDSFNEKKIIDKTYSKFIDCININENTFAYSLEKSTGIYIIKINETIIDKFEVKNCGKNFIKFIEKRNLLITFYDNPFQNKDRCLIYLININNIFPEVIQIVDFKDGNRYYNENILFNHDYFNNYFKNDDDIFFEIYLPIQYLDSRYSKERCFIHCKLISGELVQISKLLLKKNN